MEIKQVVVIFFTAFFLTGLFVVLNNPEETETEETKTEECKVWNRLQCVDENSEQLGYDYDTLACYNYCIRYE